MKKIVILLAGCWFLQGCAEKSHKPPTVFNEWTPITENELRGWQPTAPINIQWEDSILYLQAQPEGLGAWLISDSDYEDFHWEFEFQASGLQSGVVFRYDQENKNAPSEGGYIVNFDFNPNQQNPTGTIINTARARTLDSVDTEGWNKLMVEAEGTYLKIFLNGELIAETHDRKSRSGSIGFQAPLQDEARLGIRNIHIKRLPAMSIDEPLLEEAFRADSSHQWQPLFDGTTLNGWTPIGDGSWEINEGVVHGFSGPLGGFLVSEQAYKNFYLITSFRIIKEDNSGIFIRKSPDSVAVSLEDAIECNIYDHNGPEHPYSTGSIATHARAWYGIIDYQDWNTMEIFARENQVVLYVNGHKMSEASLSTQYNKKGNICLQGGIKIFSEDQGPSNIYFKEMKIKNMD